MQAPVRIAAEVDPNVHSCGSVAATGTVDLAQPEMDFYLVGARSYGRTPTFLALTEYEQVRSVVAELAGDHEAARRVELVLPDTGVCGGAGLFDASGVSLGGECRAPLAQVLQNRTGARCGLTARTRKRGQVALPFSSLPGEEGRGDLVRHGLAQRPHRVGLPGLGIGE